MPPLIELIDQKKQEIKLLEQEIAKGHEVLRHLEAALAVESSTTGYDAPPRRTKLDFVRRVLKDEKRVMKPKEIARLIQQKFGISTRPLSLGTMLHRSVHRDDGIFFKDHKALNTYGLKNWDQEITTQD